MLRSGPAPHHHSTRRRPARPSDRRVRRIGKPKLAPCGFWHDGLLLEDCASQWEPDLISLKRGRACPCPVRSLAIASSGIRGPPPILTASVLRECPLPCVSEVTSYGPLMTSRLDDLLSRLRDGPSERSLDQLEPTVWARIDGARRETPQIAAWSWRAALAAVMLTTGAFADGVAAAQSQESSPFAIHSTLAPSTLLEGGQ